MNNGKKDFGGTLGGLATRMVQLEFLMKMTVNWVVEHPSRNCTIFTTRVFLIQWFVMIPLLPALEENGNCGTLEITNLDENILQICVLKVCVIFGIVKPEDLSNLKNV